MEPGEALRQAAARELAEEIGLVVDPAALEGPVWLRRAVAPLLGVPMDHRETYFVLRDVVHEVDVSGQTELEALRGPAAPLVDGRGDRRQRRDRSSPRELAERAPASCSGPLDGAAAHRRLKMWHSRELLQTVGSLDGSSAHGVAATDSDGRGIPLSAPRPACTPVLEHEDCRR